MHRSDVATAGKAKTGPDGIGKPRLLTFTGDAQAKERKEKQSDVQNGFPKSKE